MIAVLFCLCLGCSDPDQAARAYRAGRYAEAYALYEQALRDSDADRGALLYNLGNCAYRLGRPAEAILHYRRAELRLPGDADLAWNLALAQRQLGLAEPIAGAAPRSPEPWLLPAALLQTLGLCCVVLLQRRALLLASCAVAICGAGCAGQALRLYLLPPPALGVVLATTAELHAEPGSEKRIGLRLTAGETVRVLGRSGDWLLVGHPRARGWAAAAGIGTVD